MRMAWQKLEHVFSVRPQEQVGSPDLPGPQPKFVFKKRRPTQDLLSSHPVDLLVVEVAHRVQPKKYSARSEHMKIVETTPANSQPKVIIETWGQEASAWTHGPTGKETRVRWESLGYLSRFKRVDAATIGGATDQSRLIVARIRKDHIAKWKWPPLHKTEVGRPMSNLLTPSTCLPKGKTTYLSSPHMNGVLDSVTDPMPSMPGKKVKTPEGVRWIRREEVARGLGVQDKEMPPASALTLPILDRTIPVFTTGNTCQPASPFPLSRHPGTKPLNGSHPSPVE